MLVGDQNDVFDRLSKLIGQMECRPLAAIVCTLAAKHNEAGELAVDPDLIARFRRCMRAAVDHEQGLYWQAAGNEAVALFGVERCTPDLAQRALRCANALTSGPLGDDLSCSLDLSVEVTDRGAQPQPIGVIPARARALLAKAERGSIVLTATFSEALAAIEPVRTAPLVGREDHVATIMAVWAEQNSKGVRAIHIAGPPGIGKSALLAAVRAKIRAAGGHIIEIPPVITDANHPLRTLLHARGSKAAQWEITWQHLRRQGRFRPLMLCVDDLHRADVETVALLANLRANPFGPAMILTAARTPLPDFPCPCMALPPLTDCDVVSLIRTTLPDSTHDPHTIATLARGNPAHALVLAASSNLNPVPVALHVAIAVELDNLGPLKPLALLIALSRRPVPLDHLIALTRLSEHSIFRAVAALEASGMFDVSDGCVALNDQLTSTVAAAALPIRTRRHLHRAWAQTLSGTDRVSSAQSPDEIAWHFEEAGDAASAANWRIEAAASALQRRDPATAVTHLAAAKSHCLETPGNPEGKAQKRIVLQRLVDAHARVNGYAASVTAMAIEELGTFDQEDGNTAAPASDLTLLRAENALARGHVRSVLTARSVLLAAAGTDKETATLSAVRLLGMASLLNGQHEEARGHFKSALSAYTSRYIRTAASRDDTGQAALASAGLAWSLAATGDRVSASACEQLALRITTRQPDPHAAAQALCIIALSALHRRAAKHAAMIAEIAWRTAIHNHVSQPAIHAALILGWHSGLDCAATGAAKVEKELLRMRDAEEGALLPFALQVLARLRLRLGNRANAWELADEAARRVEEDGLGIFRTATTTLHRDLLRGPRTRPLIPARCRISRRKMPELRASPVARIELGYDNDEQSR